MRLLVVTQYFWPESFRVNELVAELAARGHQVTVLTGVPNYPSGVVDADFEANSGKYRCYHGAQVIRVPLIPRGRSNAQLFLNYLSFAIAGMFIGAWRLRGMTFDAIFIVQLSPVTIALPGLLQRWLKGAPAVMWILDLWPESVTAVGVVRSARIIHWLERLVAFIYRRCDLILAQSHPFIGHIQRRGADPSKICYFPAWVEPLFANDLDQAAPAAELQVYAERLKIVFAGNVGDTQDLPAVLNAAELLRDCLPVQWIIVGDGRAAEEIRSQIRVRNLTEHVVMLGRFPVERMPSFFRSADVLLVTLRSDPIISLTIPGKIQSYMGAGVPVLGMLDGEGARVIVEADAGLVCPAGDFRHLAENVVRFAAMSFEERKAMGERGRVYCRREFDYGVLVSRLEDMLWEQGARSRAAAV